MPQKVNIQGIGVVNFPDGMSAEDIQHAIEHDILAGPPPEAPDRMARVGRGMMDVAQGSKQLILQGAGKLPAGTPSNQELRAYASPEEQKLSDADLMRKFQGEDIAAPYEQQVNDELKTYNRGRAAAGGGIDWYRIAGNAVAAAPIGMGVSVPATLGARIATGAALGATAGAAQYSPSGDHTWNMVGGGLVGGAAPVVGSVLRNAIAGLRPTPQAAQMISEGVPLTAGQTRGGAMQTLENTLGKLPVVGPAVRARQQEAMTAWNRNLMEGANPGEEVISVGGQQGMRELTQRFSNAYEALWGQPITLKTGVSIAGKEIEQLDDQLARDGSAAARRGEVELAEQHAADRAALRASLPDEVSAELSRIDGLYTQFAALRKAGSGVGPAIRGGTFTPAQLQSASRAIDRSAGKGATARGTAPLQPQAQEGAEVFGTSSGPPADLLERVVASPVGVLARPFYSRPVQSWMRGTNPVQRGFSNALDQASYIRALAAGLRKQVSPASAEAMTEPEQE